jgi:RNase H-fold protein (predicted Holliday junction resolvase)
MRNWRARKKKLDAVAAQLILQQFLDSLRHATP